MTEEEILFKYKLNFAKSEKRLLPGFEGDFEKQSGFEGGVELMKESLILSAPGFPALTISLRDIIYFSAADYRISLGVLPSSFLKLYDLGFEYENFLKHFSDLRNDVLIKDLLMKEKLIKPDVEAEFQYSDKDGNIKEKGECRIRAYETGLVLIPELSQIKRFPYGLIESFESKDYKLGVKLENRDMLALSMLGDQLDPLTRELSKSFNTLIGRTQELIKEISPMENAAAVREISFLLKDGKAAAKSAIEKNSKSFWSGIEEKIKSEDAWEYYNFLKANSDAGKTCVGIKKGLFGSMTGYYIWFLFPVYDGDSKSLANAVAMEAMTLMAPEDDAVIRDAAGSAGGGEGGGHSRDNSGGDGEGGGGIKAQQEETGSIKELAADMATAVSGQSDTDFGDGGGGGNVGEGDSNGSSGGKGESEGDGSTGFKTGGRATYIFRIIDRAQFAAAHKNSSGKQPGQLNDAIDSAYSDFIMKVNSCMLAINFRREPIYFTDTQLKDKKSISYKYAVAMIPELAWLRDNFIGRIIHKDIREWQDDFKELIEFNMNSADNSIKFNKGTK